MSVAKAADELKKTLKLYRKFDLLILDEWLIRCLTPLESYNLLEFIESRQDKGAMFFCTQYQPSEWYDRIASEAEEQSLISEEIMDRIIHNAYDVFIGGAISMWERHRLKSLEVLAAESN